ncbi:unnamed protein product [Closterium sp. NIES-53]
MNPDPEHVQVGGDVGARMQAAFQHVLGLGYHRVVVIGTDIPDLDGVTVAAAHSALKRHRVSGGEGKEGGHQWVRGGVEALLEHDLACRGKVVMGVDILDVDGTTVAAALLPRRHHWVRGDLESYKSAGMGVGCVAVVFRPAMDGGYYLLGLTTVLPCLFNVCGACQHVKCGCAMVLQQALSALHTDVMLASLQPCSPPLLLSSPLSFPPPYTSGHRVEHGPGAAAVALSTPHKRGG